MEHTGAHDWWNSFRQSGQGGDITIDIITTVTLTYHPTIYLPKIFCYYWMIIALRSPYAPQVSSSLTALELQH